MNILTWNVYQRPWFVADLLDRSDLPGRRSRYQGVLETLQNLSPEISCLQEAWHGPAARGFLRRYPHSLYHRTGGLVILSRFPLRAGSVLAFEAACGADRWVDKGVMQGIVSAVPDPIHIYNTHFQSGLHADVRARQVGELTRLLERHPGRAILAGDFNLGNAERPVLRPIEDLGFRDVWIQARPQDPGPTHPRGGQRLDALFVRGLDVDGAELVRTPWSDHYGVSAKVSPTLR